jgi:hypothetical protein
VDAWGLQNGPGVPEYVLSRVVESISEYLDCLGLVDLPAHYRDAIIGGGSTWARILGSLFVRSSSPVELLRRLDPILEAANARVVIFVQDVDRNANSEVLYQQIEAMLDHLRQVRRITFVLAISEVDHA